MPPGLKKILLRSTPSIPYNSQRLRKSLISLDHVSCNKQCDTPIETTHSDAPFHKYVPYSKTELTYIAKNKDISVQNQNIFVCFLNAATIVDFLFRVCHNWGKACSLSPIVNEPRCHQTKWFEVGHNHACGEIIRCQQGYDVAFLAGNSNADGKWKPHHR